MSSYFRSLFQRDEWQNGSPISSNSVISVDQSFCSVTVLKKLVDFAYTQKLELDLESVFDIIGMDFFKLNFFKLF